MEFMTVKQATEKWGLSERRLQTICNEGMIPGVVKFGRAWAIPMDAEKPVDKRIKSGKYIKLWFGNFRYEIIHMGNYVMEEKIKWLRKKKKKH